MTKTTKNWLYAIFLIIAVLFPQIGKAQIFESRTGVDTLTFAERISLRTNAVDWTLLTPNLGSYNIVVFLTICISYANNCFTL